MFCLYPEMRNIQTWGMNYSIQKCVMGLLQSKCQSHSWKNVCNGKCASVSSRFNLGSLTLRVAERVWVILMYWLAGGQVHVPDLRTCRAERRVCLCSNVIRFLLKRRRAHVLFDIYFRLKSQTSVTGMKCQTNRCTATLFLIFFHPGPRGAF